MGGDLPAGYRTEAITGCILAGGRSRRMGGIDKGLIELDGLPMVAHIAARLRPQVDELMINANRNRGTYGAITGCRVVEDGIGGYPGPLAGMASAMENASTPLLVTVPCDSPLIAGDYVARLLEGIEVQRADIAVARGAGRLQPVFALLHCNLLSSLLAYLESGERKIDRWYARHRVAEVDFADCDDMFLNVNTPEDHARMGKRRK